jgi:LAO/AO transport system kinase
MQRHAADEGVFIRSLATRGYLGGLSRSTQDVINVMDAMGKDIILVETVGVGQDEVEIVNTAHTSVVIFVPGLGDDIQAIKAGIIEIGDLFVINKSDREGADRMERDLRMALDMGRKREDGWEPPILKTEAISGRGITELVQGIYRHRQTIEQNRGLEKKMKEKARTTFLGILEMEVMKRLVGRMQREGRWETLLDELANRRADPYSIAESLIAEELGER